MGKPRPVGKRGRPTVYEEPRHLLGIRVSRALRDRLKAAAERSGRSVTQYVVDLLERHTPK